MKCRIFCKSSRESIRGGDLIMKVFNHTGAEVLPGPSHSHKDTTWAHGTVSTIDKVGHNMNPNRKEIEQYERDQSVDLVLSGPPHPPNETNSNYDQKDLSSSPDLETSQCRSVTIPSNAEGVSSTQVNGLEITSDRTQNPCEGGIRPESEYAKTSELYTAM